MKIEAALISSKGYLSLHPRPRQLEFEVWVERAAHSNALLKFGGQRAYDNWAAGASFRSHVT